MSALFIEPTGGNGKALFFSVLGRRQPQAEARAEIWNRRRLSGSLGLMIYGVGIKAKKRRSVIHHFIIRRFSIKPSTVVKYHQPQFPQEIFRVRAPPISAESL
jgi:hypothetical protein